MIKEDLKAYLINECDTVIAEKLSDAVKFYEEDYDVIDSIIETNLSEKFWLLDEDGRNTEKEITLKEGIEQRYKDFKNIGVEVEQPWIICSTEW